jgi:type II secretory pathway component GspD/PulD (secretin)
MATPRPPRQGHGILAALASLLAILLLGPVAWLWAGEPNPGDIPLKRPGSRLHVAVQQGQLSVDLWEADVEEVLAQIGQKAGIPIIVSPSGGEKLSVQFTGVALEQGLRRVLQLASRNYAMLYAPAPAGGVAIQEVRVFGKAHEGGPIPIEAERAVEEPMAEAGQRFVEAVMQHHAAAPPVASEEESNVVRRFRDALEPSSEPAPWSTAEHESEAVRRFQDALEGATGEMQR